MQRRELAKALWQAAQLLHVGREQLHCNDVAWPKVSGKLLNSIQLVLGEPRTLRRLGLAQSHRQAGQLVLGET